MFNVYVYGYPHYMLFVVNMIRSDHLVIPSYMVPFLIISGHYDVISKKSQKLLISRFLVPELFFRYKQVILVISFVFASKWWVTWPFSHYELENDQFDHFIGKFIPTSGLMIGLSRNDYFWNQWLLGFNLRYHTWHKSFIHRKSSKKL